MLTITLSAQKKLSYVSIQPKVGVNISNITNMKADSRIAYNAGVDLEYITDDLVGASIGFNYSMQGCKDSEFTSEYGFIRETLKLDYLNIPVMVIFHATEDFSLKVGIQPSFNLLSRLKVGQGSYEEEVNLSKLGVEISDMDYSIPVGVSYTFKNGLILEGRYNLGINEILNNSSYRNTFFQIMIGYKGKL